MSNSAGRITARPRQILQAVFLDVDGTLLDGNHPDLSPSTFDALRSLQKRGIKVALNTSWGMASVLSVPGLAKFPFDGYILAGGGEIYDHKRRLLERQTYIPADLKAIFDQCKAMNIPVFFNNQKPNLTLWTEESKRFARKYHLFPLQIKDWSGEDITMITVIDSDPEKIARILEAAPGVYQVSAGSINQDLYPEGVSKGAGIKKMLEAWHLEGACFVAVGDSKADESMFEQAALRIAMPWAQSSTIEASDFVCEDHGQDTIAYALKGCGLLAALPESRRK
ncbi:HAD family hydrolase [Erysipelotrichaceae bacterium 51-3]